MRNRPLVALILIFLVTALATWIALPGDDFDIADFRRDHPIRQGLDLQGGLQVVMQANPPEGVTVDADMMNGLRDTIERRVNGLGVSEPLIQTRGSNQIIVELPGLTDVEQAIEVIRTTALLEIIDPQGQYLPVNSYVNTSLGSADEVLAALTPTPEPGAEASPGASPVVDSATPSASPQASPMASPIAESTPESQDTGPVFETIISGSDLADAFVTTNQLGQMVVGFRLTSDAADRFWDYTSTNIGRPMSILIDKQVISSPVINAAISNEGTIEGIPANEVQDMVVQLQAGALAVPLDVVQSRTVGPTLGQDSIDRSLIAGMVGLGAVALFMILFYRLPGVISVISLLIYTAIVFALYKLIPVTLTLAGIAGFILSIGMAVDANVLIFARMKEEMRTGRNLRSAIEDGFNHAWPSIRDSNITSMITSAILYWFGQWSGASLITGFALTLFVGVAVSFLTAITITRTLLRLTVNTPLANPHWWFGIEHDREEIAKMHNVAD
ncbi:MAG: protein translocase subunit SecD [Thermomicrobiales bacterium]|nr:protein translocase subunit SecD [Thermomicrobiales bacterium]